MKIDVANTKLSKRGVSKLVGTFGFLLAALMLFAGLAFLSLAEQPIPQPHQFYGDVVGAPPGSTVSARIDGVEYETTTVEADGRYGYDPLFKVPADDPNTAEKDGGEDGDVVKFYVEGVLARQCMFESGATTELDLYVEIEPPPIGVDVNKELIEPVEDPAVVSDTVQFEVAVTNTGETDLTSLPFTDTFTSCLTLQEAYQDDASVEGVGPEGPINWDLVDVRGEAIAPGETVVVDLHFLAEEMSMCTNQVSVIGHDAWEQQDSASDEAQVEIVQPAIGVEVSKTLVEPADSTAIISDTVAFQVVLTNTGETEWVSGSFTDTFDSCLGLQEVSVGGVPVDVEPVDGVISEDLVLPEPLEPGQAVVIDMTFIAEEVGENCNAIEVVMKDAYDQEASANAEACLEVVQPAIDLMLSKELVEPVDGKAMISDTVQFQIVISNTGDTEWVSAPFTDTWGTCMSLEEVTIGGVPVPVVPEENTVSHDLVVLNGGVPIQPGEGVVANVTFLAEAVGEICCNEIMLGVTDAYEQETSADAAACVDIVEATYLYLPLVLNNTTMP